MNGDRTGSPDGAPFSLGHDAPFAADYAMPPADVKVAGAPAPSESTALLTPPSDEWASDRVTDADRFRPASRRLDSSLGRPAMTRIAVIAAAAVVVVGGGTVGAFALGGSDSGKTNAAAVIPSKPATVQADPANDPAAQQAIEAALRRQLLDRASRAARKDAGSHPALATKGTPLPTSTPSSGGSGGTGGGGGSDPIPAGQAQQIAKGLLGGFGFSGSGQFGCLVNLWNRESHWNTHAANSSGAYGIPQALPGSKMASAGSDWHDSAKTQIKWGLGYIKNRYNTPCGAWGHSQQFNWY